MGLLQLLMLAAMVISHYRRSESGNQAPPKPIDRAILALIVAGLLIIALMPEAWFVLPAFDAVGLDVVVVLVALEIGRYSASVIRVVAMPFVSAFRCRLKHACLGLLSFKPKLNYYGMAAAWLIVGAKCTLLHALGMHLRP